MIAFIVYWRGELVKLNKVHTL